MGWGVTYNASVGYGCGVYSSAVYNYGTACVANARFAIISLVCSASVTFTATAGMTNNDPCSVGYQFTLGVPGACTTANLLAPGYQSCTSPSRTPSITPTKTPSVTVAPSCIAAPTLSAASGTVSATLSTSGGSNVGSVVSSSCGTTAQELPSGVGQYLVSYRLPATQGTLFLDTCGGADQTVDTLVAVGVCAGPAAFTCVAADDDSPGCGGNGLQSRLSVVLDGRTSASVIVVVTAYSSGAVSSGAFTLNYTFVAGVCGGVVCASPAPTVYAGTRTPSTTASPGVTPTMTLTAVPTLVSASSTTTQTATPSASNMPCSGIPGLPVTILPPMIGSSGSFSGSTAAVVPSSMWEARAAVRTRPHFRVSAPRWPSLCVFLPRSAL